VNLGRLDIVDI
jgi:hypothetical protein